MKATLIWIADVFQSLAERARAYVSRRLAEEQHAQHVRRIWNNLSV